MSTRMIVYGINPGLPVLLLPVWVLLILLIGTGLGTAAAAYQVKYRDVGLAMPVVLQVWLFATPVLYPLSAVKTTFPAPLYVVYTLNPMAGIVDTFRRAIVLHQAPEVQALATSAAVVALLVPAAYVYFKYIELTMADVV